MILIVWLYHVQKQITGLGYFSLFGLQNHDELLAFAENVGTNALVA